MKIRYLDEDQDLKVQNEENLLELCLNNNVPINHSCEGMASCGTCRVMVTEGEGQLPSRNPLEAEMAEDRKFKDQERLACQLPLESEFGFHLPNS